MCASLGFVHVTRGGSVVSIGAEVNGQHINYTIGMPPLEDVRLVFMIRSLLCIFNFPAGRKVTSSD